MRKILRMFFLLLLILVLFLIISFRSGDREGRGSVTGCDAAVDFFSSYEISHMESGARQEEGQAREAEEDTRTAVSVEDLGASRVSREQIRISWLSVWFEVYVWIFSVGWFDFI